MNAINNMFGVLTAKLASVEAVRFLKNPGKNLIQELQGQGYKKVDYNTAVQKDKELVERLKNKANTRSNIVTGGSGIAGGLLGAVIPGAFSDNPKLRSRIISGAIGAGLGIAGGLHAKKRLNDKIDTIKAMWSDDRDRYKGEGNSYFVKESSAESLKQLNIIKNINPERLTQLRSELRLTKGLKNKLDLIASEARVQQNNATIKNIVDKIKLQSK
jgi:hypothetical protein